MNGHRREDRSIEIKISKWQHREVQGHDCNLFCTSFFSLAPSRALRYKSTLKECGSKDWSLDSTNLFLAASKQMMEKMFAIKQSYIQKMVVSSEIEKAGRKAKRFTTQILPVH